MHRRIIHPVSLSFIACLVQVEEDALQKSFAAHSDSIPIAKRSDALLGALLISMHKEGQIESVVMSRCTDQKFCSTLPHLLPAFEELVKKKLEAKEMEENGGLDVYNETTCYEFHQLMVATVLAYRGALNAFVEAENQLASQKAYADKVARGKVKQEKVKERKAKAKSEKMARKEKDCGRTQGSESAAGDQRRKKGDNGNSQIEGDLRTERQVPEGSGAPKPTTDTEVDDGSKPGFADPQITLDKITGLRNECAEQLWRCAILFWRVTYSRAFSYHLFILREGALIKNPFPTYARHFSDKDDIDQGVEDEIGWLLQAYGGTRSADRACRQWARLQCNQLAALSTLARSPGNFCVSLVDHQHPKLSDPKMEHWEITLTNLLAQKTCGPQPPTTANSSEVLETEKHTPSLFNAQTVICLLKRKIDEFAVIANSNSIFHAFKPKKESPNSYDPIFYGNTHCEIDFAAFSMNPDEAVEMSHKNAERLKEMAEVCLSTQIIAMF
jgi:hypothetical protein